MPIRLKQLLWRMCAFKKILTIREDVRQATATLETSSALANDDNLQTCLDQVKCVESSVDAQLHSEFNRPWHDGLKHTSQQHPLVGSCQKGEHTTASDMDTPELSFSVASWPLDHRSQHLHSVSNASDASVSTCSLELVKPQQRRERLASRGRAAQFSQLRRQSKPPSPVLKPSPPSTALLAITPLSGPSQASLQQSSLVPPRRPSTSPARSSSQHAPPAGATMALVDSRFHCCVRGVQPPNVKPIGKRRPSVQPTVTQD